ncbi:T9SS type A sorting domain-containing protein [Polaribacter aestuariivivens]|uniref:T9SS type A sorting domain-containing protein n=1 Tax=Polaribacter aestuariivivens TaxID=2304626 RepID=UPI003F49AFC0
MFVSRGISQQLHQTCSADNFSFNWDTTPNNNTQFDWNDGNLTNTLSNIDNSGVNMTFTFSGDTASLERWQGSSTTTNSPAVGQDASASENLQFYTSGFNNSNGVTITINFSEPVYAVGFDILHINLGGQSGDKFTVSAKNTLNNTILPSFTNSASPSYSSNESTGSVTATNGTTNSNSWLGVNFTDNDKISSITIQWQDCDVCTTGFLHGAGLSGFSFCKTTPNNNLDTDNDTIADVLDIDDDNDGILDTEEQNCTSSNSGTASGNNIFTINNGVRNENELLDGINGNGARFNNTNDELVVNIGKIIPANTIIKFQTSATNNSDKTIVIEQSNIDGSTTSNPLSISHNNNNNSSKNTDYTLTEDTQYIKISMSVREGGRIEVDYLEYQAYQSCNDIDTDNDGIPNRLDSDSDNDGCSDAIESAVPANLLDFNGIVNSIIEGDFGNNGYLNTLEDLDASSATSNFTNTYNSYALDSSINGCGEVIITQVYQSGTDRWIEIKNIHPTAIVPENTVRISIYLDKNTNNLSDVLPDTRLTYTSVFNPGQEFLFKNTDASITNVKDGVGLVNNNVLTAFDGENDFITLSKNSINQNWDLRTDVVTNIPNNSSYIRSDLIDKGNRNFTDSEWILFVDDNLDPYQDSADGGPERHPHAPLLSEIISANTNQNSQLGEHNIAPTIRTGSSWSNGLPDRSRTVIINENFNSSSQLPANTLSFENEGKLTLNNALLVVNKSISFANTTNEIRLAGNSQLIQTHQNNSEIIGTGKVLKDVQTSVRSIYRYTYMSSPVNSIGANDFSVANVLKDGTNVLSENSDIVDINFVNGFDGDTTSPIKISNYWIYTYASGDGTRSNYVRKGSDGAIPETDGFLMKGTGTNQNYTFVGSPKDGTLTTAIGANESYLVGNPYASAINSKKFIEDNLGAITGTLYFWQHAGEEDIESSNTSGHNFSGYVGGYATRNISMGLAANQVSSNNKDSGANTPSIGNGVYKAPEKYIAVGQGFFIGGSSSGGNVVFNNSQREYKTLGDESLFFKTSTQKKAVKKVTNKLPIIKLGMDFLNENNKLLHRQIGISFNENNSFNKDLGYDSELFDLNSTDIYWKFPEDENKYAIAGVQSIREDLEIPLEIIMNYSGEISIKIDEISNVDVPVYLIDKITEKSYLLENNVNINLETGTYTDRFFISFNEYKTLKIKDNEIQSNEIEVYYNTSSNSIIIKQKNSKIKQVKLYALNSKMVEKWKVKSELEKIELPIRRKIKSGFYIINIKTNKGVFNKKILIKI